MTAILRNLMTVMVAMLILTACAGGEGDAEGTSPIRLQANAVGGGQLFYEDLASEDTVLWFWAPW